MRHKNYIDTGWTEKPWWYCGNDIWQWSGSCILCCYCVPFFVFQSSGSAVDGSEYLLTPSSHVHTHALSLRQTLNGHDVRLLAQSWNSKCRLSGSARGELFEHFTVETYFNKAQRLRYLENIEPKSFWATACVHVTTSDCRWESILKSIAGHIPPHVLPGSHLHFPIVVTSSNTLMRKSTINKYKQLILKCSKHMDYDVTE